MVDKRLRFRKSVSSSAEDAQVGTVWVENWLLLNFYSPPDRSKDAQMQASELLQEALLAEDMPTTWIAVGDANETPADSCIALTLNSFQGIVLEQGCPSRWEGQAELDWAQCSQPSLVQQLRFMTEHFSDHKCLECFLPIRTKDLSSGFLKSRPDWHKPVAATTQWWRETLSQCWDDAQPFRPCDVTSGSIDDNWDRFTGALEQMFRAAFQMAFESNLATPQELARALRSPGSKGSAPVWRQRTLPRAGPRGQGSMPLRRLRRSVAQLYELRRHLSRSARTSLQTQEAQKLAERLGLGRDLHAPGLLARVAQQLASSKAQLYQEHQDARKRTLRNWQNALKDDPKALGRWLRARDVVPIRGVVGTQGILDTPQSIASEIKTFWENFWNQNQFVDPENVAQRLRNHAHVPHQNIDWEAPSLELLVAVFRAADGAAGGDGFAGRELRHLPEAAISLFRQLALQWQDHGCTPSVFAHTRMVNFGKPGKVSADGLLPLDGCRPISVLTSFWRLWGTAWMRSPSVKAWMSTLPSSVVAGTGADSLFTAAQVFAKLGHQRYAGSMDFTKCYDLMIPCGTAALLEAGGWPRGLVQVIAYMWQHQQRWVSWDRHTHGAPLAAGTCVPQGCSFGPLALAAWMAAGVRATDHNRETVFTRVFMDDRTIVSSDPQFLVNQIQRWETWSESVGLLESKTKTQLTGATQLCRTRLASVATEPAKVQSSFEILGCCAQVSRRTESIKEKKRLAAGHRTLQLIGNLGWPFERFLRAAQSHVLSKCTYGWLARLPTSTSSWKCWAQVRRAQRVHQQANKYLRAIIFGGNCHLDMLVASNLIRVVARLLQRRCVRWADRSTGGSPVATLHKWFSLHGFSAARPWTWISDHVSFKVDLQRMPIKNAQHAARQGWRWHLWQKFLNCGRHECDEVRPLSLQQFVDIDFKKVRQSAIDHTFRAVCTGAMLSPAAMQHRDEVPINCPWCENLGHWNHVVWLCDNRPVKLPFPDSPVKARFGWGASPEQVNWITQAAAAIWNTRHAAAAAANSAAGSAAGAAAEAAE